jgi:ElaB/YqjD/DUF883 family membrane-anchored ribosome-binding protein
MRQTDAVRQRMELYYKDLISEDASLEKLVDDLLLVVQGTDAFVQAAGAALPESHKEEITSRLKRLKESCQRVKQHAVQSALATDKVLRQYPYSFAGFAFAFGVLAGVLVCRSHCFRRGD